MCKYATHMGLCTNTSTVANAVSFCVLEASHERIGILFLTLSLSFALSAHSPLGSAALYSGSTTNLHLKDHAIPNAKSINLKYGAKTRARSVHCNGYQFGNGTRSF